MYLYSKVSASFLYWYLAALVCWRWLVERAVKQHHSGCGYQPTTQPEPATPSGNRLPIHPKEASLSGRDPPLQGAPRLGEEWARACCQRRQTALDVKPHHIQRQIGACVTLSLAAPRCSLAQAPRRRCPFLQRLFTRQAGGVRAVAAARQSQGQCRARQSERQSRPSLGGWRGGGQCAGEGPCRAATPPRRTLGRIRAAAATGTRGRPQPAPSSLSLQPFPASAPRPTSLAARCVGLAWSGSLWCARDGT